MKKIAIIIFFLSVNCKIYAQDKLPAFGKIDIVDLEIQDCSFDPGAEAMILLDIGEIEFNYINNIGWVYGGDRPQRVNYRLTAPVDCPRV